MLRAQRDAGQRQTRRFSSPGEESAPLGDSRTYCAALAPGDQFEFVAWVDIEQLKSSGVTAFNIDLRYDDLSRYKHVTGLEFFLHVENGLFKPVYNKVE